MINILNICMVSQFNHLTHNFTTNACEYTTSIINTTNIIANNRSLDSLFNKECMRSVCECGYVFVKGTKAHPAGGWMERKLCIGLSLAQLLNWAGEK